MQKGDKVKPTRFPNGPTGEVKHITEDLVAVKYVMNSGTEIVSFYEFDELEVTA